MERFGTDGVWDLFNGIDSKRARRAVSRKAAERARAKLQTVVAAIRLEDLRYPQQNRLKKLDEGGKYHGYHTIRINDEYRILFVWTDAGAFDINIDDHH
jgi:proteic killer suppression protein